MFNFSSSPKGDFVVLLKPVSYAKYGLDKKCRLFSLPNAQLLLIVLFAGGRSTEKRERKRVRKREKIKVLLN